MKISRAERREGVEQDMVDHASFDRGRRVAGKPVSRQFDEGAPAGSVGRTAPRVGSRLAPKWLDCNAAECLPDRPGPRSLRGSTSSKSASGFSVARDVGICHLRLGIPDRYVQPLVLPNEFACVAGIAGQDCSRKLKCTTTDYCAGRAARWQGLGRHASIAQQCRCLSQRPRT